MKSIQFSHLTLDGSMGGLLLERSGAEAGFAPERLNIEAPETVARLHREYVEAGADVVYTNTFGANEYRLGDKLNKTVAAAIELAKSTQPRFVALDIGPLGKIIGTDITFEDAVEQFKKIIRACADKTDFIVVETMTDLKETRAAVIAAKEASALPVIASMSFQKNCRTAFGNTPEAFAVAAEALGVSAIGANCSVGPDEMYEIAKRLVNAADVPVFIKPNAGMPVIENGRTIYGVGTREFARSMQKISELGISVLGGCCGTTPEYVSMLAPITADAKERPERRYSTRVSCASSVVNFSCFRAVGERINPTGKKLLKKALIEGDYDYVLSLAMQQAQEGADILDINCGLGEIDETAAMCNIIERVQDMAALPLQIDTSSPKTLEAALRIYNGRAIVNSVNGEEKSLKTVLPIAAKYGACVIGLTLDEHGIPDNPERRAEIAERIIAEAEAAGIRKEDVFIDALTLSEASERGNAKTTVETVRRLTDAGIKTVLGISNVSFGLPDREDINAAFLELAKSAGLSAAIINPKFLHLSGSAEARALLSGDEGAMEKYIAHAAKAPAPLSSNTEQPTLEDAIIYGKKDEAVRLVKGMLKSHPDGLKIAKEHIVPALDEVGKLYENGKYFLPQLIASADAAKEALQAVEETLGKTCDNGKTFLIASVKGDIHDIGKNIVKAVVSNFGYKVVDLGRDVDYGRLLFDVEKHYPCVLGLSALMTTTAKNMAESIKIVRSRFPEIPVLAGGAVLTPDYAEKIGAVYCSDAIDAVKKLEDAFKNLGI